MSVKIQTIIQYMEEIAPKNYAEEWDNVGLQIGNPDNEVEKILVTLDVTKEALDDAIRLGAKMIISHHPLLFKPIRRINLNEPLGQLISTFLKHDITLYVAHTNLDISEYGINNCLAKALGINELKVLKPTAEEVMFKLVVFVPEGYENKVREALCAAGAGWIGNYSCCTFQTPGKGTFMPLEGANPFIGEKNRLEHVTEYRLETIVPKTILRKAVSSMLKAHPYEEVAYDLIPLSNQGYAFGLGRVGYLNQNKTLQDFALFVKEMLKSECMKVIGDPHRIIKKVAVCGGSGGSIIKNAAFSGADVLVTGDIKYHDAMEALENDICIIDAGHFETEFFYLSQWQKLLQEGLSKTGEVQVVYNQNQVSPFWSI